MKGRNMFHIKYDNGYSNLCIEFANGWKRLNSMNAATFHTHTTDKGENNALGHVIETETYFLVSYATPIAKVKRINDCVTYDDFWHVYINEVSWNCSASTRRQLSRFLSDVCKLHHISYQTIKASMLSKRMHFFYDDYIAYHVQLFRRSESEIEYDFASCPWFGRV